MALVGIDFGTSYINVAIYSQGTLNILTEGKGYNKIPAFICLKNRKVPPIRGKRAKCLSNIFPHNTFRNIKNGLDNLDTYNVEIKRLRIDCKVTPAYLTTQIFVHLKTVLCQYFGETGILLQKHAVITVPLHYNNKQRKAIVAAARSVNFVVVKLLDDPVAAALAYYYRRPNFGSAAVLVLDLGSSSCRINLLNKLPRKFQIIKAFTVSTGGKDFDQKIVDYVMSNILFMRGKYVNFNSTENFKIYNACEKAKKMLSVQHQTLIKIKIPRYSVYRRVKLTRCNFESMIRDFILELISTIDACLRDSKLYKEEINDIIMVGGLMYIPKIKEAISKYFIGKDLIYFSKPDESIVEGAALQGALISLRGHQRISEFIGIEDVLPLPIGIEDQMGIMRFILLQGYSIPCEQTYIMNLILVQEYITINIYEGLCHQAIMNRFLGTVTLEYQKPYFTEVEVSITLYINKNGELYASVSADDQQSQEILSYTRGELNYQEVELSEYLSMADEMQFEQFSRVLGYILDYYIGVTRARSMYQHICNKGLDIFLRNVVQEALRLELEDITRLALLADDMRSMFDPLLRRYRVTISTDFCTAP